MPIFSDFQLIAMQLSTLFVCDADGRLRYAREPGYAESELDPAPRFFLGRTKEGNIWRFRYDLPADLVRDLDRMCRAEPTAVNLAEPPLAVAAIRDVLRAHAPLYEERGPAYWISDGVAAPPDAVLISAANASLLEAHFPWKWTSRSNIAAGPLAATVVEGRAVSICYCSRIGAQAAEAGVETAEPARGRGYAVAAVARWASAVRQRGLIPLYSTTWDNIASQGVARKLGIVCYGEDWLIM